MIIKSLSGTQTKQTSTVKKGVSVIKPLKGSGVTPPPQPVKAPESEPIQITPTQKKIDLKQITSKAIPKIKYVAETIVKGLKLTVQDIKQAKPTIVSKTKKATSTVLKTVINAIPPVYAYNVNKKAQTPEGRKELTDKANAVWKFISPEPLMGLEPGTITPKKLTTKEGRKDLASGISTLMSALGFATLPSAGPISQLASKPGLVIKNIAVGGGAGFGLSAGTSWLAGEKQNWWNNAFATVIGMYFGAAVPEKQLTTKQAQVWDAKKTLDKYGISNKEEYIKWMQKNHPDRFPETLRPLQEQKTTEVNNAISDLGKNSLGVGDKMPKAPTTLSDTIKWVNDTWKKVTNPPSKTGRAIVLYQPPIEDVITPGSYTSGELVGKIIVEGLEKTPEGKQIIKVALEAQRTGQNVVVSSALEATKVPLPKTEALKPTTVSPEAKKVTGVTKAEPKVTKAGLYDAYHGTEGKFAQFGDEFLGKNTGMNAKNQSALGHWFTDNATSAKDYGKNVIEARLNLNKPKIYSSDEFSKMRSSGMDFTKLRQDLMKQGYDGVVVKPGNIKFDNRIVKVPGEYAVFEGKNVAQQPSSKAQDAKVLNELDNKLIMGLKKNEFLANQRAELSKQIESGKITEEQAFAKYSQIEKLVAQQPIGDAKILQGALDKESKNFIGNLESSKRGTPLPPQEQKLLDEFHAYTMKPEVYAKYQAGAKDTQIINDFLSQRGTQLVQPKGVSPQISAKPSRVGETPKVVPQAQKVEAIKMGEGIVRVPREQLPIGEGKVKVSRLEARLKGVIGQATQEQIDTLGLTTYNEMNKKETIAKSSDYVVNNTDEALQVLEGKIQPPKGQTPESIYVALTELAKDDYTLATKIETLGATALGQRIGILTELNKNNPVVLMNDIIKVREETSLKRYAGRDIKEVTKKYVAKGEKMIKVPTLTNWKGIIEKVRC